jgi:hypothetical protein
MFKESVDGFGRRIERATIVMRKSGEGYRLVLGLKTAHGTPVPETLPNCFSCAGDAQSFALHELGLQPSRIRVQV